MTILRPNSHRSLLSFSLLVAFLILAGGLVYIYEYNSFVNVRHDYGELKALLVKLQAANANLKNDFYKATEPEKLGNLAREKGLLLEKKPEYLTSNQWLSDSSR